MKTVSVLVLFSLAIVALSDAGPEAVEGESCTPFIQVDCGEAELISESETPAGDSFG